MQKYAVSIIGAGKVAQHLYHQFLACQLKVDCVWARDAKQKSVFDQTTFVTDMAQITPDSDVYIICVSDQAIEDVAKQLLNALHAKCLVVHCSGATPASVLAHTFKRFGIFYPLQSFSVGSAPDWTQIPICVSANLAEDEKLLLALASSIAPTVKVVSDEQRLALHVAAVFVNNFSNHLFAIAKQICDANQLDFNLLKPLITETIHKIQDHEPKAMQTGPAVRNDSVTIARHLDFLGNDLKAFSDIYKMLTVSILNNKKGSNSMIRN